MADEDTSIWSKMSPASFEVDARPKVLFPVFNNLRGAHGIRVVGRAVPWVNGEQLDETGTTAKEWTTLIPFWNDLLEGEPGIGSDPILYPDRLDLLESILELRKTGTLHLPWRRNIRCKAITWERVASDDKFDGETLQVTWRQDNENKLENPSASAGVIVSLSFEVEQAVFEAEREGMWDGGWEQLTELSSALEGALAAPSEFQNDIAHKANRVQRCCESILESFTSRTPGRNQMNDPSGSRAHRRVRHIRDAAARADSESRATRPRVRTRFTDRKGSIWSWAVDWKMDPYVLLDLNRNLPDPNLIPQGTGVVTPAE